MNVKKKKISVLNIILFVLLAVYSISLLYPMFWAVITSVKEQYDFLDNVLGMPAKVMLQNFATVFEYFEAPAKHGDVQEMHGFWQMVINTILYVGGCSLTATFIPCITAYAVAKFPQKKMSSIIYGVVIAVMMIPIVGSYPSEINMLQKLGLYNTMIGMWIQRANFLGVYFLVFHAAFKGLSKDFSEAAEIDGASEFVVMTKIMLPLVKNIFFTVFLVKFVEFWNDYQAPLLYLPGRPTLSYGLYYVSNYTANMISTVPMRMAGCIIVLIPILILFIAFNDKLMGNITLGGVKG